MENAKEIKTIKLIQLLKEEPVLPDEDNRKDEDWVKLYAWYDLVAAEIGRIQNISDSDCKPQSVEDYVQEHISDLSKELEELKEVTIGLTKYLKTHNHMDGKVFIKLGE